MSATVSTIMVRTRIIEMIRIGISNINPERPSSATHIDRTEKISGLHETGILSAAQHPAQIVITYIQIIVITIQSPFFPPQDIVHQIPYTRDKVIIDFVHIIILFRIQFQLIGHLVRKEACLFTHFTVTHSRMADSGTHYCGK